MAEKAITVRLIGDGSSLSKVFKEGADEGEGFGSKIAGVAKLAAGAVAGVATSVAAGAVKSIQAFAPFQKNMNEVFTLLPDLSAKGMDQMTGQVKSFAKEFAILPEQVVPALYQSLSAGVPKDNVFAFLETSQKLAKGGATDLETAVDGLSSTVNAYGAKTLSAKQASDLMFTTVKMGKTTIADLSASLFNVNPVAASVGVKFKDVSAALAAITLQGVPTSVATTQLRALFVELSKEGSGAAATFEKLAGTSFKAFVAGGGTVQQALQLMEKDAKKNKQSISDMFSSVEAGGAALALTGTGTEAFTNSLKAMDQAAGATDTAYNRMNQGIQVTFDRIKARLAVFMLDVGDRLAPYIEAGVTKVTAAFEKLSAWWKDNQEEIVAKAVAIKDGLVGAFNVVVGAVKVLLDIWDTIGPAVKVVATIIGTLLIPALIGWGLEATASAAKQVAAWVVTKLWALDAAIAQAAAVARQLAYWTLLGIGAVANATKVVAGWVATGAAAIAQAAVHVFQVGVMVAKWVLLGAQAVLNAAKVVAGWVVMGAAAVAQAAIHVFQVGVMVAKWAFLGAQALFHAAQVAAAWLISMGPIILVIAAVVGLVALIVANWDKIKAAIGAGWDWVAAKTSAIWDWITGFISGSLGAIGRVWSSAWGGISGFFSGIWDGMKNVVRGAVNWIIDKVNVVIRGINRLGALAGKIPGVPDIRVSEIPALAAGGTAIGGGLAWVGERGPELLNLPAGASVIPLRQAALAGAGIGRPVVVEHHYHQHVEGSVIAERQLMDRMRQLLIQEKRGMGSLGLGLS